MNWINFILSSTAQSKRDQIPISEICGCFLNGWNLKWIHGSKCHCIFACTRRSNTLTTLYKYWLIAKYSIRWHTRVTRWKFLSQIFIVNCFYHFCKQLMQIDGKYVKEITNSTKLTAPFSFNVFLLSSVYIFFTTF